MPLAFLEGVDPWIFAFSFITVVVTVWMGFRSAKTSKTASDFFVAGRSVSVGWNASAISGEYLSAASFMGVAGMVMSSGYDALWYPVCYACGYLFLLLFIAGPLRRFVTTPPSTASHIPLSHFACDLGTQLSARPGIYSAKFFLDLSRSPADPLRRRASRAR